VNPIIQDYELQAIMTANTPAGTTWKEIAYHNADSPKKGLSKLFESYFGNALGEKMWQRSDDAILWRRSKIIVRLELPAAREYEAKLKAEKEQNGANGLSDIEDKAVRVAARECGKRPSFNEFEIVDAS
jgi:hypothetical protein